MGLHGRGYRSEVQEAALVRVLQKADDLGVQFGGFLAGIILQAQDDVACRARGLAERSKACPEANPVKVAGCFWLSRCLPTSLTK